MRLLGPQRPYRLGMITIATLFATSAVHAQPAGDIDMDADPQAPAQPAPPPADTPAQPAADAQPAPPPVVKDPKVAKKWLDTAATLMKKGDLLAKKGNADEAKTNYSNAALAYATGEFTAVFDADHQPDPDSFRRAWRWIAAGPAQSS